MIAMIRTERDVLTAVRQYLERCWCQQATAYKGPIRRMRYTQWGESVPGSDPEANCWCLLGAFQAVAARCDLYGLVELDSGELGFINPKHQMAPVFFRAWNRLRATLQSPRKPCQRVTAWNDTANRRQETVLMKVDQARGGK